MKKAVGTMWLAALVLAACQVAPAPSSSPAASAPTAGPTAAPSAPASQPAATPTASPGIAVDLPAVTEPVAWPSITALAASRAGFLALADTPAPPPVGDGDPFERALVLGSPDATSWQRLDAAALGGWPVQIAGNDAGWVMSTVTSEPDGVGTVTLWHSPDGRHWSGVPIGQASSMDLIAGPQGYLYVAGKPEGDDVVAWSSTEGATWRDALLPIAIEGVTATPGCLVAWGEDSLAVSRTGESWKRLDRPAIAESMTAGLFALDGRLSSFEIEGPGTVTIVDSARFEASPDPCGFAEAWTENDKLESTFDGYSLAAIPGSNPFPVVYGYDARTHAPAAWTNSGTTWRRHDLAKAVFDSGMPGMFAFGGSAAVAVGVLAEAGGSTSRLWRSTDGLAWQPVETDVLLGPPASTGLCSTKPTSVAELIGAADPGYGIDQAWNFARLVRCFGSQTLRLEGYRVLCECGGTTDHFVTPRWRDWFNGGEVLSDETSDAFGSRLFAFVDPAKVSRKPDYDVRVVISGHFDDPGSSDCRVTSFAGYLSELRPPAEAVEICRRELVVTGFERIP